MTIARGIFVSTFMACAALAQSSQAPAAESPKYYNLHFQVQEVEGAKVVNARSYYLMVSTESNPSQVRTGGRVPYASGPGNISFIEVGVNIDCRSVKERDGRLGLAVNAEVSSLMPPPENLTNAPPVLRQNRWGSNIVVPLRKATVIFSSDDSQGMRKVQLELTATPIG